MSYLKVDQDGVVFEMPGVFLRTPYNYDMSRASDESGLACLDKSLAQQQFKEDSDINTIVERFGLTGELPKDVAVPQYGDFLDATDYQSSLNVVIEAQEAFGKMPANVRARFANDPQKFLEFCADASNRDEAKKLGILQPDAVKPDAIDVRVIEPAPKAP